MLHSQTSNSPVSNLVEIRDLQFAYGERVILSNLSMDFPRRKVVAVMGGSGCGKTTVLRLIGGQIRPQKGEVRVAGEVVHQLDTDGLYRLRRKMGMLFQFGALFTDLSVFDNVAFPLREHTDLPEQLIRDLVLLKLNAVGLRNAHKLKPSEISGGMARRVAVARAIALDPQLIMYDEPFAGLDPISMGVTANLIRKLNDALGSTSILVSHDVHECFAIADYVYFMSAGKIVAQGTPAQLRVSDDPYVKQFVNAAPDGPVPFDYPGKSLADDLGLGARP
jgi:phospholipid/cholesterol/gamma-HCH transport system ATP-binding protein